MLNVAKFKVSKINSIRIWNKVVLGVFVLGYGGAGCIFSSINESQGNGGAFIAMLAISLLFLTAIVSSLLGVIVGLVSIQTKSYLNKGVFNSYWLPFLLASPPFAWFIWQALGVGR